MAISGASQQDTFTDRELVGFAVTTTDPACNSIINTQPTDFVINLSDAGESGNCPGKRFHGERNSGELVCSSATAIHTITFHFNSFAGDDAGPADDAYSRRRI